MNSIQRILLLACTMVMASCASAPSDGSRIARNPTLISFEEIQASTATNLYDLITASRPAWFRQRTGSSTAGNASAVDADDGIKVYFNQSRQGGVAELRQMDLAGVTSITFLDAAAATQRWGTGHTHGAVLVLTSPPRQ
jgi:hypothetical protein